MNRVEKSIYMKIDGEIRDDLKAPKAAFPANELIGRSAAHNAANLHKEAGFAVRGRSGLTAGVAFMQRIRECKFLPS